MPEQSVKTLPRDVRLEIPGSLQALIEALIFASDEPLTIRQIKDLFDSKGEASDNRRLDPAEARAIIKSLNESYKRAGRPFRIVEIAGGYRFATLPEYAGWLGMLYHEKSKRKLSQSAIETLSIVVYKQPISKPEIESIRGVNCDYVIKTLLEKELITIVGRAETVGRPILYGTTKTFLDHFGLNQLTDLPRPREVEEILGESSFETEKRMIEAQAKALEAQRKREEEDFKSRLPHIPKRKNDLDEKDVRIIEKKKPNEIKTIRVEHHPEPEVVKGTPTRDRDNGEDQIEAHVSGTIHMSQEDEAKIMRAFGTPDADHGQAIQETGQAVSHGEEKRIEHGASSRWQRWKEKIAGLIHKLFG